MKRLIIASRNPVKIRATLDAFTLCFPIETFDAIGIDVPSGVPAQPMSDAETLQGATNRATNARTASPNADFWIGLEGGIHPSQAHGPRSVGIPDPSPSLEAFAWIVILSPTLTGRARTATFQLPPAVATLVHAGVELGHADDQVFGRSNSKQSNGAVGLLTRDLIDRTAYYSHAVVLALVPFLNPELYSK
jgi:inosine/xanthosine triphosphatase